MIAKLYNNKIGSLMLHRTIYWSEIGSNPPKIMKASMDGSGVGTVVLLNNTNTFEIFVFTLDYSQQMLYWMNSSNSCYYTNYIGSSRVDGSGTRITYVPSGNCYYYHRTQAIDFFGGAIYSYSRNYHDIFKTEVANVTKVAQFHYVSYYMCRSSYMYSGLKIINSERQPQGIYFMHC
jgi:hypothetical protein